MGEWEGSVSSNPVAYSQKRRSSRIDKAIPLAVVGVDALRAPYREEVMTVAISCHGCKYQMKREVLPGDLVVLHLGPPGKGYSDFSSRARVKAIQKLHDSTDPAYDVAVEFEIAGNIWGISSPPEDWLSLQANKAANPANTGRELRVVARTESQPVPARTGGAAVPALKKSDAAAALSPWFSDLMSGLSSQIQVTVTELAAATLANERNRFLDEFRVQLQNEATGTIERVIATSKEELARRALKALGEAAEATVRTSHERLIGTIEKDLEDANQRLSVQEKELSQRVDSMATGTIEGVQRTLETSRTEATARFVSRLREQVAPVLEEARGDLQKLVESQTVFKEESRAIYARVTNDLESSVKTAVTHTHEELDKNSAAVTSECSNKLLELSQTFDKMARESMQVLIASATGDARKNLEERAAEISSNFTQELEGHIRSYLEFIGESIAEFPKTTPAT
jgi:hypothetical protein